MNFKRKDYFGDDKRWEPTEPVKMQTFTLIFRYPQRTFKESVECTEKEIKQMVADIKKFDDELLGLRITNQ